MINPDLYNSIIDVLKSEPKEAQVLIETPSAYEGETLRLIYDPETFSFILGPNAKLEEDEVEETIYPSYLRNVQSVSRVIFEDEEGWISYVVSLWTSHVLNAFFVKDLDASYYISHKIQTALRTNEDIATIFTYENGVRLSFFKEEKKVATIDPTDGSITSELSVDLPTEYERINAVLNKWHQDQVELDKQQSLEKTKEEQEATEELEDEFDLDNLYDGLEGNSANPIDTSKPETVEDVGCSGGGCTL